MSYRDTEHLRVLIANERKDRLALVAPIVAALGHEVIASEIDVEDIGAVTARERPDVRGIFAYITDAEAKDWQSSIDIVLRRFTEYHDLEGAFGRRAVIERAKGILMERHSIGKQSAFEMLRDAARDNSRKLVDVAIDVDDSHALLSRKPSTSDPSG